MQILNAIHSWTQSQCRSFRSSVILSYFLTLADYPAHHILYPLQLNLNVYIVYILYHVCCSNRERLPGKDDDEDDDDDDAGDTLIADIAATDDEVAEILTK